MRRDPRTEPLWREEVSFRELDERYVNRRQFGKFLVLTSLAMFAGNLWILIRARLGLGQVPAYPRQPVARVGEVPVGGVRQFSYPGPADPCLLVRLDADTFVAYHQKCTHLSCAVVYSRERERLECPCHQGFFSVRTGAVLQGPPPRPLARIRLAQEGDVLLAVGVDVGGEA
jgi:Rieske Fe-S protein